MIHRRTLYHATDGNRNVLFVATSMYHAGKRAKALGLEDLREATSAEIDNFLANISNDI